MRLSTQIDPGQFRKNFLVPLAGILIFVWAAYELGQYILADDIVGLFFVGIAILVGVGVLSILKDWRTGTYIFFGWIFFEDLARKFMGNNMAIYFGKDVLVGIVYLSFFLAYRRKKEQIFKPPFLVALLLFVWFGLLQVFNPASTIFFFGILGVKLYFNYVPLFFVGYSFVKSETELRRFFAFLLVLVTIVAGLGIAQSIVGHTFLNPTNLQEDIRDLSTIYRVAPISGVIAYRPNSVFVSAGRFAFFLVPAWLFSFGFGAYLLLRSARYRVLASLSLATVTTAVALCASRGTLLWTVGSLIVCIPAFLWGSPWKKGQLLKILRNFQRAAFAIVAALLLLFLFYPEELSSRMAVYSETLSPNSSASELAFRTSDYPLQQLYNAFAYPRWPYGYGIGTASLGLQYVSRIIHVPSMGIGVESGFGTLILELGIVGLALYLVLAVSIVISAWSAVQKLRGTPWFPLGFVIFWYSSLFLFPYLWGGFQSFQDFILNSLLWFSLGVLFKLKFLAQEESVPHSSFPTVMARAT